MNLGKWFLAAVVLVGAVHAWHVHQRSVIDRELSLSADSNGFVPVIMPDGAPPDTVLILGSARSAPRQRRNAPMPWRSSSTKWASPQKEPTITPPPISRQDQQSLVAHTEALLSGEIPIVLLNGMAKANPTVDEVAAEYRRDKATTQ